MSRGRSLIIALAWLALACIAFVTLSPPADRPHLLQTPVLEYLGAFAALGFLFRLGYPRHLLVVVAIVLGGAVALELLQFIAPHRDPRIGDALAKLVGGAVGMTAAEIVLRVRRRVHESGRRFRPLNRD